MEKELSSKTVRKFFAIFDKGLPASDRYGRDKDGVNRWVGYKVQIAPPDVNRWRDGEEVKFSDYDMPISVEARHYRVVEEVTQIRVYENELSRLE